MNIKSGQKEKKKKKTTFRNNNIGLLAKISAG